MTHRERSILAKLELLSDASAANLQEGKTSHGKADSKPPKDAFNYTLKPQDQSLYRYYHARLQRAESKHKRNLICRAAERDYDLRVRGATRASLASGSLRQHRDAEKEAQWVCEYGEGLDSRDVAAELEVPRGWVEKVRRDHHLRPSDGAPKPGFLGLSDPDRLEVVRKLAKSGMKQTTIAQRLGVARHTVQRYL